MTRRAQPPPTIERKPVTTVQVQFNAVQAALQAQSTMTGLLHEAALRVPPDGNRICELAAGLKTATEIVAQASALRDVFARMEAQASAQAAATSLQEAVPAPPDLGTLDEIENELAQRRQQIADRIQREQTAPEPLPAA